MRWIFHLVRADAEGFVVNGRYAPPSLDEEGFIHGSYRDAVAESARLYFPRGAELRAVAIDPRRLDVRVEVADTPRGPMPHLIGAIPVDAMRFIDVAEVPGHPDEVTGTRIAFAAFEGMTLLDLVGPLDALSRIATMGVDPSACCEVVALTRPDGAPEAPVWAACGAELRAKRHRPDPGAFDVLVVPGGPGTRELTRDEGVLAWLRAFPHNRLIASVCTGSLLLGAAGRLQGRRATTHHAMLGELARFGATAVRERVVDDGQLVTAGGVTSGIELGLHLVERLAGKEARRRIATQMEVLTGSVGD
jgi:putative intracellular protease/amidase/uncharacterized protein (DUF952 family)